MTLSVDAYRFIECRACRREVAAFICLLRIVVLKGDLSAAGVLLDRISIECDWWFGSSEPG